jgi:hypothetical protein
MPGDGVVPRDGDPGCGVHPLQVTELPAVDERDNPAGGAGPRRATGAVQVVLVVLRRVELYD